MDGLADNSVWPFFAFLTMAMTVMMIIMWFVERVANKKKEDKRFTTRTDESDRDIDYGQMFRGVRVFTSLFMTKSKVVQRTWRERLFTMPWRPFVATKTIQVPSDEILQMTTGFIMHPVTLERLREEMQREDFHTDSARYDERHAS